MKFRKKPAMFPCHQWQQEWNYAAFLKKKHCGFSRHLIVDTTLAA